MYQNQLPIGPIKRHTFSIEKIRIQDRLPFYKSVLTPHFLSYNKTELLQEPLSISITLLKNTPTQRGCSLFLQAISGSLLGKSERFLNSTTKL